MCIKTNFGADEKKGKITVDKGRVRPYSDGKPGGSKVTIPAQSANERR